MVENYIHVKRKWKFISLEYEDGEGSLSKTHLPDITFHGNYYLTFSVLFHKVDYNPTE